MTGEAKDWRWPWLGVVLRFPLTRIVIAVAMILAGLLLVRPFWARTTEATNNETMGEETSP